MAGALVTHSDHGCGHAIVAALAAAGFDVATLETAALTPRTAAAVAVRKALAGLPHPELLVNNLPPLPASPALALDAEAFGNAIDAGLNSVFSTCREVAKAAVETGAPLVIVNVVSALGTVAPPGSVAAACTSAGVSAATRALAAEWGPLGIRVTAVALGPTADWERRYPGRYPGVLPLGRPVSCDDLAHAVAFLAEAPAAAGSVLLLDAGWLAYGWREGGG